MRQKRTQEHSVAEQTKEGNGHLQDTIKGEWETCKGKGIKGDVPDSLYHRDLMQVLTGMNSQGQIVKGLECQTEAVTFFFF